MGAGYVMLTCGSLHVSLLSQHWEKLSKNAAETASERQIRREHGCEVCSTGLCTAVECALG